MKFIKSIVKNFTAKNNLRPNLAGLFIQNNSLYASDIYKLIKYTPSDCNLGDDGFIPNIVDIYDKLPEKRLQKEIPDFENFLLKTDCNNLVSLDVGLLKQICETLLIYTKENKIKNNRINFIFGDKLIYINSSDDKIKCLLMGLI